MSHLIRTLSFISTLPFVLAPEVYTSGGKKLSVQETFSSQKYFTRVYLGERTNLSQQKNHEETEYLEEATS